MAQESLELDTDATEGVSEDEVRLRAVVTRVLFNQEAQDHPFEDEAAKAAAFEAVRADFAKKSRQVIKRLRKAGVTITKA